MKNNPFNVYAKLSKIYEDLLAIEKGELTPTIKNEINILKQQINNLIASGEITLPDNAEVIDLRLGADGVNYGTAGEAVRTNILKLQEAIIEIDETLENILTSEVF